MNIRLSSQSGIPAYRQIIEQVQQLISAGRLIADQELLPIRVLAERVLVNPNTVARAYKELESEGWIYKVRGAGTFVKGQQNVVTEEQALTSLVEPVDAILIKAEHMNVSLDALLRFIDSRAEKLNLISDSPSDNQDNTTHDKN